jgi:hypothetical protein
MPLPTNLRLQRCKVHIVSTGPDYGGRQEPQKRGTKCKTKCKTKCEQRPSGEAKDFVVAGAGMGGTALDRDVLAAELDG